MAKLIFSQQELDNYLKEDKESLHPYYDCNVKAAKRVMVHADGMFPDELIKERRPHEPEQVLAYREKIFVAITKPVFSKVWMSLKKIRRSQDWAIKYPKEPFTKINEKETLEQYCEKNYPDFTSVTNWAFDMFLRKYLIDSGAVGMIYPMNYGIDTEENGFVKPIVELFCSEDVLDFQPGDYAVLRIPCGCKYYIKKEQKTEPGRSYYIVTTKEILRYDQIDAKENFKQVLRYEHGLDELPVRQMPGIILEHTEGRYKKETPIAAMLPELDEAVREYSDLQAAKVLHIYPERWEYTQNECTNCKGTGRRPNPDWYDGCGCPSEITCATCNGHAYTVAGPFSKIMVRPVNNAVEGGGQIPNPPAGFIDKDTKIVELQEVGVKNHKYYALAAINFEFLADTPLSESGVAKEVDRDELNNTVHGIAEDIVSYIDWVYGVTAKYRYKALYNFDQILTMLPAIGVPEVYDLISSTHLQKELIEAKNGKLNPIIQSALENDYTAKRFNTEPEVRNRLQLIFKLDPLPNVTEDDKMILLSNNGIDRISYIISSNINEFVQRALHLDENFAEKDLTEQKEVMKTFAAEVMPEPIVIPDLEDEEEMPMPPVNGKPKPVPA